MSGALARHISRYEQDKHARYAEYGKLLDEALRAGDEAAAAVPAGERRPAGMAWVRVADGRSSFAFFVREERGWRSGSRGMGTYLPAGYASVEQGRAWAGAVCRVLAAGGVEVTAGSRAVRDTGK